MSWKSNLFTALHCTPVLMTESYLSESFYDGSLIATKIIAQRVVFTPIPSRPRMLFMGDYIPRESP